jgi:hypothetical protein
MYNGTYTTTYICCAREETDRLAAGEDHKDARKKIEKDFSSPEQMP